MAFNKYDKFEDKTAVYTYMYGITNRVKKFTTLKIKYNLMFSYKSDHASYINECWFI